MAGKLNNIVLLSRMKNISERNKKNEKIGLTNKDMLDDEKNVMVYEFVKNQEGKVKVSALELCHIRKLDMNLTGLTKILTNYIMNRIR